MWLMSSADRFVDDGRGLLVQDAEGNDLSLTAEEAAVVAAAEWRWWDAELTTLADEGEHTGAMVALVPADPESLALDGGEPVDELHLTLFYLGDAADIPPELRKAITAEIGSRAANNWSGPIEAQVFGASIWNPTGDEPSLVLNVGGSDLRPVRDDIRQGIVNAPDNVEGGPPDWVMAEQHQPWAAHICVAYGPPDALLDDMPTALADVGPVVFDRVRVAFADEVYDYPLGGADA